MIFLIDDKQERQQKDYRWNPEKLNKFQNVLKPIYSIKQIDEENLRSEIFKEGNIIMLHESFFDNPINKSDKDSIEIRKKLDDFVLQNNSYVIYFSGSKSSRTNIGKIAHVPVSVLYQNLEIFLDKAINEDVDLDYLLFGTNPDIENELLSKLEEANNIFDDSLIDSKNESFIFQTEGKQNIPVRIENSVKEKIFISDDFKGQVSDAFLIKIIRDYLLENNYENIFIPLCFGPTLSDFNGLRLATFIRCVKSINQLSNIFIYSFIETDYFYNHECFNILKTKNVRLIGYTKESFEKSLEQETNPVTISELPKEVAKLKLDMPKNYNDNHTISNEWAIYRWSHAIGVSDKDIKKVVSKVENQLYFKYLQTIYPVSEIPKIEKNQIEKGNLSDAKILYIDDEADKGWNRVLWEVLKNNHAEDFVVLGDELTGLTKNEIIELALNEIREQHSDIVILDFRLHGSDFSAEISEVTGLKILKKIKEEINPGIQVIIFSATNKVWNLQKLLEEGADGFIMKESPENSIQPTFSIDSVNNVISIIEQKSKMVFLRKIFTALEQIKTKIKDTISNDSDFINDISSNLHIAFDLLYKTSIDERYFNYAFIQLFLIIEQISTHECFFKEQGSCAYVINNNKEVLIQQEIGSKIQRALKLTNNGKYEIQENKFEKKQLRRLDTNFKVSSILIFRNGNINSSVKKWTNIYVNRNTKAAHFNKESINSKITIEDIYNIIDFISYFVDSKNVNELNIGAGLTEKSLEDALSELRKDPRFKNK